MDSAIQAFLNQAFFLRVFYYIFFYFRITEQNRIPKCGPRALYDLVSDKCY
jgi:hypothetical protein